MKIAAHVLAYNVNFFLEAVIKNIEPHVGKIYIAHSERPWGYIKESRQNLINPTKIADLQRLRSLSDKIEIVSGDWLKEEDTRNECLNRARDEGFDWFIIQDADEFYTDNSWNQIKKILFQNKSDDLFITTWYNFWKSPQYVLSHTDGSIKGTNAGFAVRCAADVQFVRKRICNAVKVKVIDCPCYHYGYVMSDEQMNEKLSTWGHAKEFNSNLWYKYKWKYWNERAVNLHPTDPSHWKKAIRFPLAQPDFAVQFDMPLSIHQSASGFNLIRMGFYNTLIKIRISKKSAKRWIKNLIG